MDAADSRFRGRGSIEPALEPDLPICDSHHHFWTHRGRYLVDEYRRACAQWPAARITPEFATPVKSAVPTLLISGYFDPVTPPSFADAVARTLTVSRRVVSPDGAHGSVDGCPKEAALFVLRTGTLDGMPDVCR